MTSGGFVFADTDDFDVRVQRPWFRYLALQNLLLEALRIQGVDGSFEKLPNSHPVYHCYFDFDGPPPGFDGWSKHYYPDFYEVVQYLRGLEIDGHLAILLSGKMYVVSWYASDPHFDATRGRQFAVNTIIFALTQEGSITRRLMDSIQY
jgi:hypothetical protein